MNGGPPSTAPPPASWLERLAGLAGLLVLAGVAVVLGYDGLIRARAPPDIVVEATMADGRRETATLRLDQVAAGSQEEGGVVFAHEPRDLALIARSFTLP